MKLELVSGKELAGEVDKTRRVVALASEQTHASAHLIGDGLSRLAVGLVVLGFALVVSAMLARPEGGDNGAVNR